MEPALASIATKSRLGDILVRRGVVRPEQLRAALDRQKEKGEGRIGEHLVALGVLDEDTLTRHLADQFALPLVDVDDADVTPELLDLVPHAMIRKNQILPIRLAGSTLTVAVSDPSDMISVNQVRFLTGYDVRLTLAPPKELHKTIERLLGAEGNLSTALKKIEGDELEILQRDGEPSNVDVHELERASEDAPVVALVNAILADAVRKRASDVHIEPYEKIFRVRFRIDGVLHEIMKPPLRLKNAIVSRIKIMANLDIAERRLAHDGRIKLKMGGGREVDVRVSILPTYAGEKIVLRLLDKATVQLDLTSLGYQGKLLEEFRAAYTKPHGMILVTGPTGSGKTTTLYAVLNELNKSTVNISTAEDPIEYNIAGINQVQVHEGIGRGFSYILRSFLRQDPDIIMVGEIRDFETGEMALKAALTGHLVLSTLHTNDAPSTVSRLLNMGFEPFLLASALNLILAQRLIRKLCPICRREVAIPPDELVHLGFEPEELEKVRIFEPVGCDECGETGYKGRIAISELLTINDTIRHHVLQSGDGGAGLRGVAIEQGMVSLRRSALRHLAEGNTTIEECVRVTTLD